MRREQILKICLNHALTPEIDYQPKDDKSWHFVAQDFSEGKVELLQFCLRFKTAEIATAFKVAIDGALAGSLVKASEVSEVVSGAAGDSDQSGISNEDKRLAESLKLPANFYAYKNANKPCPECRGCQTPDFQFAEVKQINLDVEDDNPLPLSHPVNRSKRTTPNKGALKSDANKNTNSVFGGTPLSGVGLFGSATPFGASPSTGNIFGNMDKPSIFASGQKSIFGGTGSVLENGAKPLPSQSFSFGTPTAESPFKVDTNTTSADTFSFKSTGLFGPSATVPANSTTDLQPKSLFGGANIFKPTGIYELFPFYLNVVLNI